MGTLLGELGVGSGKRGDNVGGEAGRGIGSQGAARPVRWWGRWPRTVADFGAAAGKENGAADILAVGDAADQEPFAIVLGGRERLESGKRVIEGGGGLDLQG